MAKIVIIYSTTDGHTKEICKRLKQVTENSKNQATLKSIMDSTINDLEEFDKIIIGASIRYGKHSREVYSFIERNIRVLENKPNAFFSVNVVARKPEKNQATTNPYLIKFLNQISWKPQNIAVFAGKIDYQKYSFWDRFMIRLIMRITKGPTDPKTNIEFTNWEEVEEFGQIICKM